jgi:carbon-monoxide dehydrogenase small subunit
VTNERASSRSALAISADGGAPSVSRMLNLRVNGRAHRLLLGYDVRAADTLAFVLRDRLGYTGLKVACDGGACGACTVLVDGAAVLSGMMLAAEAEGRDVTTIEGLPSDHPVVVAFAEQSDPGHGTALQCGYCTPGFVLTAVAFLARNPDPAPEEIREGLSNNLCRCGCYQGIVEAVLRAAPLMREGGRQDAERPEADPRWQASAEGGAR